MAGTEVPMTVMSNYLHFQAQNPYSQAQGQLGSCLYASQTMSLKANHNLFLGKERKQREAEWLL